MSKGGWDGWQLPPPWILHDAPRLASLHTAHQSQSDQQQLDPYDYSTLQMGGCAKQLRAACNAVNASTGTRELAINLSSPDEPFAPSGTQVNRSKDRQLVHESV